MKQVTLFIAFTFLASFSHAAILRCNNSPSVTGTYTTVQAAHDAASPGDTIHLEPTINGSYGQLTATKKIILISTGDFLNENPGIQNPFLQPGYCDAVSLDPGSEYSTISSKVNGVIYIRTSNITVVNSHANEIFINQPSYPLSNILISKNIVEDFITTAYPYSDYPCSNLIITNNFCRVIHVGSASSAVVTYNTVMVCGQAPTTLNNCIVSHNIFSMDCGTTLVIYNSNVSDNITNTTSLPSINNNLNNVDMSTVFNTWNAWSADHVELNPSYTNQDLGMFAGPTPYKLATTPQVPSIYKLEVPASAVGNTLNFKVSTRSNN